MQLFERIRIISSEVADSQKQLATLLGLPRNTFQAYLKAERQDNLWPLLPRILEVCPQVRRDWLYFGEGAMLITDNAPPPLTAENAEGRLTGDLLDVVLGFMHIMPDEAARRSGIDKASLDMLLESRVVPNFAQLEALYTKLGIIPAYFFDGNEHQMCRSNDPLLCVYYALGLQGIEPDAFRVSEIFAVDYDEAKEFLTEWREFRKQGRALRLPKLWDEKLTENTKFCCSWLLGGNPPVIMLDEAPKVAENAERLSLPSQEINDLQKELLEARAKIIALQEELLSQTRQLHSDPQAKKELQTSLSGTPDAPTR